MADAGRRRVRRFGTFDDHFARIILVFLWIGWGLITYSALRWKLPRLPAAMLVALQLSLPEVTHDATDGLADVLLAGFYGGMIYLILRLREDPRWPDLISAALLATAAAFTKHEGMPLACFGAALVLVMVLPNGLRKAAIMSGAFLGIIGVLLAPFFAWSWNFPRMDEDYTSHLWAVTKGENLARLRIILPAFGSELLGWGDWGPLWALLLIAAVVGYRAFRYPHVQVLWALLGAHFVLYIFVYVISPFEVNWLVDTALNRVILHICPIAILLIGYHWADMWASDQTQTPSESDSFAMEVHG